MKPYIQLGWASDNLIRPCAKMGFQGAIWSPVDLDQEKVQSKIKNLGGLGLDHVLDPQLFKPDLSTRSLSEWDFWPSAFRTADSTSIETWKTLASEVVRCAAKIGCGSAASPTLKPRIFTDDYYKHFTSVASHFNDIAEDNGVSPLQTVIIDADRLLSEDMAYRLASIVTSARSERYYVILYYQDPPRPASSDVDSLSSQMKFVSALRATGGQVMVGYAGTDVLLHGTAGADICATGKFLNLRAFSTKRFDGSGGGRTSHTYWYEEALLASIVSDDLQTVANEGLISGYSSQSIMYSRIRSAIASEDPWRKLSWLQFFDWFAKRACQASPSNSFAHDLVTTAAATYSDLDQKARRMLTPHLSSRFVRAYRRALED